eukprot:scaffold11287_cov98-Cylindrotheca_fusiformis.AAC.2
MTSATADAMTAATDTTTTTTDTERPSQNIDMIIIKKTATRNSGYRRDMLLSSPSFRRRLLSEQTRHEAWDSGVLRCCKCLELVQWTGFAKAERTRGIEAVCRGCCKDATVMSSAVVGLNPQQTE